MADLPIGIDKVPDQMHGSYLANYGAQRKEMSQDEMIAYYNNWAKQGKYENVKTVDFILWHLSSFTFNFLSSIG